MNNHRLAFCFYYSMLFLAIMFLGALVGQRLAGQPTISDSYPLNLEEVDFPAVSCPSPAICQTTFSTTAAPKNHFFIVFRNGLLQRPCPTGVSTGCDYAKSGNEIATFPVSVIQDGDSVTLFYFR